MQNEKEMRRRTNQRREVRVDKKMKEGRKERRRKNQKERGRNEQERREREKKKVPLISKIYGNWIVSFRQSKRQSQSTHRELRVGTKILEFRQAP